MAVSNSSDFTRTRDQIIHRSARLLGAVREGQTPGAQLVTDFSEALNSMVKAWQAKPNMKVWKIAEVTIFPQVGQSKYSIAVGSSDHATETHYETAVTTAASSGATSIPLDDTTNITALDNIGIVVDDGTLHWTTVVSKSSTAVVITTGIDDDASAGNAVFTYTTKVVRPLKITDWRRYDIAAGSDLSMSKPLARLDYLNRPNKATSGSLNHIFYDPQLASGYLYVWQPPSSVTDLIKATCHLPLMDFDAAGNNPDLPQEWLDAIIYNLAVRMAPEYDVPGEKFNILVGMAATFLDDVSGFDREAESIEFGYDAGPG